jgi:hypothetical protein
MVRTMSRKIRGGVSLIGRFITTPLLLTHQHYTDSKKYIKGYLPDKPDSFGQHLPDKPDSFCQTLFPTLFVNIRYRMLTTIAYYRILLHATVFPAVYYRIPLHATVFCTAASRFCAAA